MTKTKTTDATTTDNVRPAPADVLAMATTTYDTALGTMLQRPTRKGGPKHSFESMATARARGLPFLKAFVDVHAVPSAIEVVDGSIVTTLPHAYLRQDVDDGTFHVHMCIHQGKTRSMASRGKAATQASYVKEASTPDEAVRIYVEEMAPRSIILGVAHGAVETEDAINLHGGYDATDLHQIYDALFSNLQYATNGEMPNAAAAFKLGHDVIDMLREQSLEIKRIRPANSTASILMELEEGTLRQQQSGLFDAYYFVKDSQAESVGPSKMDDAAAVVKCYVEDVAPGAAVQRRLDADAKERAENERLDRLTRGDRIVAAYEAMNPEIKEAMKTMLAFVALGEERHGGGLNRLHMGRLHRMHMDMDHFHMHGGPPIATTLLWQIEALERKGMPPERGGRGR